VGEVAGFLEERVITAELRLSDGGRTLYTRWGEWVQALAVAGLGLLLFHRWRASS
jgi:apolipoprotein N-acyltransferase